MSHGVMCQGAYEANIGHLAPGRHTFIDGGVEQPLPEWPADVDGIRFGALERRGRWLVARVAFDDQDVILHTPVPVDPLRHLGGRRRGTAVVRLTDDLADRMLDDVLRSNPAQTTAIALVVNRVNQVRRAAREAGGRSTSDHAADG